MARGGLGGVAEEVRRDRRLLPPQSAHWGSIRAALWPLRGKALAGFTTRHPCVQNEGIFSGRQSQELCKLVRSTLQPCVRFTGNSVRGSFHR